MIKKYNVIDEVLYIYLEGRIDANNAPALDSEIATVRLNNQASSLVLDIEDLEYISSAGLRVILRLKKQEKTLKIVNAQPSIYEIFEMTGFTDIVDISKAFRKISVDNCEIIGRGANGNIYRYDAETIVKLFKNPNSLEEIKNERELARKAFVLGINTAIPYDIVKVGECYGTVFELLNATSISKMIAKNPTNLDHPAELFVDMLKKIHEVTLNTKELPDIKEINIDRVKFIENHLPKEDFDKLYSLIVNAPEGNNLIHGDYHTGNVMVQDGESILIDMDTLCMGHPIFELSSMFNAFVGFSDGNPDRSLSFLGYDDDTAVQFWNKSLRLYLGTEDEERLIEVERKAMVVGYVRLLRRTIRREADTELGQKLIKLYKQRLHDLIHLVDTLDF